MEASHTPPLFSLTLKSEPQSFSLQCSHPELLLQRKAFSGFPRARRPAASILPILNYRATRNRTNSIVDLNITIIMTLMVMTIKKNNNDDNKRAYND